MTERLFPAKTLRLILIFIAVFLVLDLFLLTIGESSTNSGVSQNGSETIGNGFAEVLLFYLPVVIGIPVLGLLIGLIVSLIPYKGIAYSKKYWPFSLISILILFVIVFARILIRIAT